MNVTDEMVERAAEAIRDQALQGAIKYTNGKILVKDIDLARAALEAALGDVEPLVEAHHALVTATDYLTGAQQKIMEARAAVANAKEQR